MNAATQNEMGRLVRVNLEQQTLLDQIYEYVDEQDLAKLGQCVKALIEAHKRAEAERDALAASLQDVRIADSILAPNFSHEVERRTADPTACLACLKAQWQAEALEEVAFEWRRDEMNQDDTDCVEYLERKARHKRRQAEGSDT